MRSFLLTAALYRSMIEAKGYREILAVLSKTNYQGMVNQLESSETWAFEKIFLSEEIHRLQKIAKLCKNDPHQMTLLCIERYDVEKMKVLLRLWHKKEKTNAHIYEEKIVYHLPVNAILSTENLEEIILLLEGTPFQQILSRFIQMYKDRKTIFPLELALDKDYFERIWQATAKLNQRDRRIAQRLFGIEIDLTNLDWMNRFRTYYNTSSAEIGSFLLPHGYQLGSEEIQTVLEKKNIAEILTKINGGIHASLTEEREEISLSQMIEYFLYRVLSSEAKHAFSEFPFSIGAILGYMVLQRIESKNLKTLIYAKSYHLPSAQIESLLVL
ncbi:V-type ATPase subunit [bacterium]|nr:V-type ATPase subunit [bacterium]